MSGLFATAAGALIGNTPFAANNFLVWYSAHVIGMVLVATSTLIARLEGADLLGRPGRRLDFAISMLLIMLVTGLIFAQSAFPLLFLAYPPLLWAAFRHGFGGVICGIGVLTVVGSVATALGHGPLTLVAGIGDTGRTFLGRSSSARRA